MNFEELDVVRLTKDVEETINLYSRDYVEGEAPEKITTTAKAGEQGTIVVLYKGGASCVEIHVDDGTEYGTSKLINVNHEDLELVSRLDTAK